jgi:ribonuclease D
VVLSDAQKEYAANDVLHLHAVKKILDGWLVRDGRVEIAQKCFDFLPTRAMLDLISYEDVDIFAHT